MTCDCPEPDLCRKLGRHMNPHLLSIWYGTNPNVTPEAAADLRSRWVAAAVEPIGTPATKPTLPTCPHLWKRVRDEQGNVKTRLCKAG